MKQKTDFQTAEIPGLKRPVGRPATGKALTAAERVRLHRQRKARESLTVDLSSDLVARLDEFAQFKDESKRDILERILRNHLMRKR